MKNKILFIFIIFLLAILVVFSTLTYLNIYKKESGKFIFKNSYNDIIFNNIEINDDITVKINDNSLNVNIPNLTKEKPIEFSVYLNNIGNKNTIVNGVYVDNISSKIKNEDIIIDTSLVKGDTINKKEIKQLIVNVKYIGKENNIDNNLIFNLNYLFDEVKL